MQGRRKEVRAPTPAAAGRRLAVPRLEASLRRRLFGRPVEGGRLLGLHTPARRVSRGLSCATPASGPLARGQGLRRRLTGSRATVCVTEGARREVSEQSQVSETD